jgi:predicted Zn-dependent peptidase
MRRFIFYPLCLLFLVAAATLPANEIPDRPEKLTFPDLDFAVPDADALRFELSDGTPVYAKQDTQFPLVTITVYFHGGRYLVAEGKEGLATLADEVWRTGGAGDLTAQELDEELDFLAANLGTNIGDVTGSATLNVLSKDLDQAMALFMDVLTKPRFQEDRFEKAKDDLIQLMKQRNDDSAGIEGREWRRLIYGDDYWSNRLATKASVDGITAGDCKRFISSLVRSGNIVVAVAGDFEPAAIEATLEKMIGSLEPTPPSLASTSSTSPTSTRDGSASATSASVSVCPASSR